jgi:hypothetical protein
MGTTTGTQFDQINYPRRTALALERIAEALEELVNLETHPIQHLTVNNTSSEGIVTHNEPKASRSHDSPV